MKFSEGNRVRNAEPTKKYDLIVIGGCSAGLAAAINAARLHPKMRIAVIEKMPRIGKKILATGNGRCNLTNENALSHAYHNAEFAFSALKKYPPEKIKEFFGSMGMLTKTDSEGRVYPRSNNASSVLDALRFEVEKNNIDVFCDKSVKEIIRSNGKFIIDGEFSAEKIIVACGGASSPSQGSDGSIFNAVKSLGHKFTPLYPSLVPLNTANGETKALKGVRASGVKLTARNDNSVIAEAYGEILFTDSGISGIAAMELASAVNENVKGNIFTDVDFLPEISLNELTEYIKNLRNIKGNLKIDELLTGAVPKMVGIQICKAIQLYSNEKTVSSLNSDECSLLAKAIKKFTLKITGTRGFADSQVTRGGINIKEINPGTMESLLCKNLYFSGEIIDVDGGCGGFNLQWAWSSGLLAGELKGAENA